jgi:hypothetical protein
MASTVKNCDVENCLRELLATEGFRVSDAKTYNGQTGVDIRATKDVEFDFYIEAIGYKATGAARTKDFCEVFFRAVSRLKDGAKRIVIALPAEFQRGMSQRVENYGKAWIRIGRSFPELEIWFVDTQKHSYVRKAWNNC